MVALQIFYGFESYIQLVLKLPNIGTSNSYLKIVDEKYQGNYESILNNEIFDETLNQIPDMIEDRNSHFTTII